MTILNYAAREITAKIVYYGPGKCGKTTNLEFIHSKTGKGKSSKLISMATETDRTIFFDLLPMHIGSINGFKIKIQLLTVPGQVFYNSTRKVVLTGADGVVFVADSQKEKWSENVDSVQNLTENLQVNGLSFDTIPLVLQLNKQDMPDLSPNEELLRLIKRDDINSFPAIAITGQGVIETYQRIVKEVIKQIRSVTGKGVKPLAATSVFGKLEPGEKSKIKIVSNKALPPVKGDIKKVDSPPSSSGSPEVSPNEESLNKMRDSINTLIEENNKIKSFCFKLKKRLQSIEEKLDLN